MVMPELPEVETVVRGLRNTILNETIVDLEVPWEKAFSPIESYDDLVGQCVMSIQRRAKYILIHLEKGSLVVHLRMTGKLTPVFPEKHVTVILHFRSGNSLFFQDMRKFGRMEYTLNPESHLAHLGPEPLAEDFTASAFYKLLHKKKRLIKPLLLDQTFVAGLGNIYVDEALFQAGIQPLSLASSIPRKPAERLHSAIQSILLASIEAQGTTVINFSHGSQQTGSYQQNLKVYGRGKQPCFFCDGEIEKIKVGQRGTHYCPRCQKKYS
jgi:formamidopyrimidine-DNA glycosylase